MNMTTTTREQHEAAIMADAAYYTSIVFCGRGRYDRREYRTYEGAMIGAKLHANFIANGRGAMVYAVDSRGHDTLVATVKPSRR